MAYTLSMDLGPKQSLSVKQNQLLMMLPQMQQAITLLQMPIMEMSTIIEAELEHNPVLEYLEDRNEENGDLEQIEEDAIHEEPDGDIVTDKEISIDDHDFDVMRQLDEEYRDFFAESGNPASSRTQEDEKRQSYLENSVTDNPKMFEFLMHQAQETFDKPGDLKIAEAVIGNLDEKGFLQTPAEEIALLINENVERIQEIIKEIQLFEPHGIAAKDLKDSLLIQLRCLKKENSLAYKIVEKHYDDLLHNRIPIIQRKLASSYEDIRDAIENHIAKLEFRPGSFISEQNLQTITADLTIEQENDDVLTVIINDESVPQLRLNKRYMRLLYDENLPIETKDYIKQNILSAKWLMRNIFQRNETLKKIGEYLADKQKKFLSNVEGQLVPLTMKTVAQDLQLHESTIARAVANKYINTPRGLLPLRSFFSTLYVNTEGADISSKTVQHSLKEIIETEDKKHPLSDEAISAKLKEEGIICARRTIAKYRRELNIGNALQRRKYS